MSTSSPAEKGPSQHGDDVVGAVSENDLPRLQAQLRCKLPVNTKPALSG